MNSICLQKYREVKKRPLVLFIWRIVEKMLWPFLPCRIRNLMLRLFGAKVGRSLIYGSAKIYAPWNLEIGDWSCVGPRVEIYNKNRVVIGDNAVISQDSYVCTASHDVTSPVMELKTASITIGSNVWVAARAMVMPGREVGEGAVVAAGAVVTKDVEPWTVVGGNPAKFIKKRELV